MGDADRSRGGGRDLWSVLGKICGSCQGRRVGDDGADGWDPSSGDAFPNKGPPIVRSLACSLEDLYKGATRKMKISRDVVGSNGKTRLVEEILTLNIKPGWKKGTKITFLEKGNEEPNLVPSDLIFVVDEKPHEVFARDGDDLVVVLKISLLEALTGYTVELTTLDGRKLVIPITTIISPSYEEVVEGEGMPIRKGSSAKGNLKVRFQIKFPNTLTADQKTAIREVTTPFLTN